MNGGRGNDVAFLGDGADTFVWNPGDGSDTVEGENGSDTLLFNGANINEKVTLSANGTRLRFFRDVANITMDVDGVEKVAFNALGGVDTVTVDDLSGTAVTGVAIDLANPPASGTGDGAADDVIVNGTAGDDNINVTNDDGAVKVERSRADRLDHRRRGRERPTRRQHGDRRGSGALAPHADRHPAVRQRQSGLINNPRAAAGARRPPPLCVLEWSRRRRGPACARKIEVARA